MQLKGGRVYSKPIMMGKSWWEEFGQLWISVPSQEAERGLLSTGFLLFTCPEIPSHAG